MNVIDYVNEKMEEKIIDAIKPITKTMLTYTVTPANWGYAGNYWFITLKLVKGVDIMFVNYYIYSTGRILTDFKSRLEPVEPYQGSIETDVLENIVSMGKLLRNLVEKVKVSKTEENFFNNLNGTNKCLVMKDKKYYNLGLVRYNKRHAIILEPVEKNKEPNVYDLAHIYTEYKLGKVNFAECDKTNVVLCSNKGDDDV